MKIGYQWATATPQDWSDIDSKDWAKLPDKGEPIGGEVIDDTPGYVYQVNVQGVCYTGDKYAVRDMPGTDDCEVFCINDDPDDYDPLDFYAHVWTFQPLAPDPDKGGAINTRQSHIIYAAPRAFERFQTLGPVENRILLPWSDFEYPPENLIRHGIWLPDQLSDLHGTARSLRDWREWSEGVDPSRLDPETGKIAVQRDLGFWSKAEGTITYFQRDTDRATGIHEATNEDALEKTTGTSATESATLIKVSQRTLVFSFTTPANEPNSSDWPDGTYRCQLDCTFAGGDVVYGLLSTGGFGPDVRGHFARVNSGLTSHRSSIEQSQSQFTGTGLKLATVSWTPGNLSASDRFECLVWGRNDNIHMDDTITLRLNISDSFADGPWTVPLDLVEVVDETVEA